MPIEWNIWRIQTTKITEKTEEMHCEKISNTKPGVSLKANASKLKQVGRPPLGLS
jgi:hypothetical protein